MFWLQQPPLLQTLFSQQGCPGPPQAAHFVSLSHDKPLAVQKSVADPRPVQQFWPVPPHVMPPPIQVPAAVQVALMNPLQADPPAVHVAPVQQPPFVPASAQSLFAQQACPVPPQVTAAPLAQTVPGPTFSPVGMHLPPEAQEPALHEVPLHAG